MSNAFIFRNLCHRKHNIFKEKKDTHALTKRGFVLARGETAHSITAS
jgi:hypothetical protein